MAAQGLGLQWPWETSFGDLSEGLSERALGRLTNARVSPRTLQTGEEQIAEQCTCSQLRDAARNFPEALRQASLFKDPVADLITPCPAQRA